MAPDNESSKAESAIATNLSPLAAPLLVGSLAVIAVFGGWLMPEFYDWSESEQSELGAAVWWVAGAMLALNAGLITVTLWRHFTRARKPQDSRFRFRLGNALLVFTIATIILVTGRQSVLAGAIMLFGGTGLAILWQCRRDIRILAWSALIVWFQLVPFAWIIREPNFDSILALLAMLPSLPVVFPFGMVLMLFQIDARTYDGWFLLSFVTVAQFWCGIVASRIGHNGMLVFSTMTATCSYFGSFILHALMRA